MNGGRFDFDDGGTYCGGWEEGKANGHGVCTGPDAKGEYAGAWHYGFEVSGVYTWPSGNTYQGQWQNGKRHGLGMETRGRWIYRGEWTQGLKGRYGLRQALHSKASYLGTWVAGLHDGYGTETYVDGGTYKGQWQRGLRHGCGIRTSAAFGVAAKYRTRSQTNASLTSLRSDLVEDDPLPTKKDKKNAQKEEDEFRGGFVLRVCSDAPSRRRRSLSERSLAVKRTIFSNLRIKKQHSTGDIHQRVTSMTGSIRSSGSTMSCASEDESERRQGRELPMPAEERVEENVMETYKGEWKNDKRSGFGICERTDGVKYAGEWFNNRKHGYGVTFFKDGTKEEGRYKNNVLVCSTRRKGLMFVRTSRLKERIENSLQEAKNAADYAQNRVDLAMSRTSTAQEKADAAYQAAERARDDADTARICATQFDPTFRQPGIEHIRRGRFDNQNHVHTNHVSFDSIGSQNSPHRRFPVESPLPNFAPSQLYHQIPSNAQTPNPLSIGSSAPPTTLSFDSPTDIYMAQQQQQYAEEISRQMNRVDEEAAFLLQQQHQQQQQHHQQNQQQQQIYQQQQFQQQNQQQNQIPIFAQIDQIETPNEIRNVETPQIRNSAVGNSVGHRLQTSTSLNAEQMGADVSSRVKQLRGAAEGRSTMSLSDDHYDQYTINKSNSTAPIRRNRPSLTRQTGVLNENVNLNRRSTLASSRDRQPAADSTMFAWEKGAEGDRGSLPNLDELAGHGVTLRREDAARLASQRRQETQRLLEEEELLRANPLRYLFHPTLRNWLFVNRGLIALLVCNAVLIYVLISLLARNNPK